jgi:hypothetical protein
MRYLVAIGMALGLLASPVLAAEPVTLTDHELDQVTAGDGSLLELDLDVDVTVNDVTVLVNLSNVPVNLGAAVQVNALGQAIQQSSITAFQEVTQMQVLGGL